MLAGGVIAAVGVATSGVGEVAAVTLDMTPTGSPALTGQANATPNDGTYESCAALLGEFEKAAAVNFVVVADGVDPAPVINEDLFPVAVVTFEEFVAPNGVAGLTSAMSGEPVECALNVLEWDDEAGYLDYLRDAVGLKILELDDTTLLRLLPYPGASYTSFLPLAAPPLDGSDTSALGLRPSADTGTMAEVATSVAIRIEGNVNDAEVSWAPASLPVVDSQEIEQTFREKLIPAVAATGVPLAADYFTQLLDGGTCEDDDAGAIALEEALSIVLGVAVDKFPESSRCERNFYGIALEALVDFRGIFLPQVTVTVTGATPGPKPGPGPGPRPEPSPATPRFTG
jgi:hypothetical protein